MTKWYDVYKMPRKQIKTNYPLCDLQRKKNIGNEAKSSRYSIFIDFLNHSSPKYNVEGSEVSHPVHEIKVLTEICYLLFKN